MSLRDLTMPRLSTGGVHDRHDLTGGVRMNERALRRACRDLLRSLKVEPPLDMMRLCARVGEVRGRPIQLVEFDLTDEIALSWSAGDFDVITWRPHTSSWHRDHSIAHELGHCLCGHIDPQGGYGDYTETTMCDIAAVLASLRTDGPAVPGGGRRACYDSPHEATVELIATTLLQWSCVPGRAPSAHPAGLGLARVLSWRRGWL